MPFFRINGGNKLRGKIKVNGAKNSALKIIPASILSNEKIIISNVPDIEDVKKSLDLMSILSSEIKKNGNRLEIQTKKIKTNRLEAELAKKFRASVMFVGPMLARFGEVQFPHPGGCVIGAGSRPIDLFLEGFKCMGADIKEDGNFYRLKADKLKGCEFFFSVVSVMGTEAMMTTAVLAEGETTLFNCAMEPEIKALADYLNKQGAKISGAGTPTIKIKGVKKIKAGNFKVIPDRIETGSFAIMAAASKSNITITDCDPDHIKALLSAFVKIGVPFKKGKNWLKIKPAKTINPHGIKTHEYPGFATDLQSPYTVLMTQARGSSLIHETIYDRRLFYVDMLAQMGADITICDPHRVVVNGPVKLYGKTLTSPDIRAGIAMVIAGLIAEGATEIHNIYQIERGYENLVERLRGIGADIEKII